MSKTGRELITLLERHGSIREVAGNSPFLLDGSECIWIVRVGKVELFSVAVESGQPVGARHHFTTVEPGDALFDPGLNADSQGIGLLVVGVVGTRLLRVGLDEVRRVTAESGRGDDLAHLLERWIEGLSAGVSRTIVPQPRADLRLEVGGAGTLRDGERLRASSGVVWIGHEEGETLFVGMEEAPPTALFPLTSETFLQALGGARVIALGTAQALSDGHAWEGLRCFTRVLLHCEGLNVRLMAADEHNRLRQRSERDQRVVKNAIADLASVLGRARQRFVRFDAVDPLVGACQLIGDWSGFAVREPPPAKDDAREKTKAVDPLMEIARASRFRTRKVVLKGEWWRQETTPLLAFLTPGHRPVALMPVTGGGHELHDPVAGTSERVTEKLARTIEPLAYVLYEPFPERPLKARDVYRFGLKGNSRDIVRPALVGLLAGLLGLLPPHFTGRLVDTVIPEAAHDQLIQLGIVLAVIAVVTTLLGIVRRFAVLRLEIKASSRVQPAMWDRLLSLPVVFFRRYVAGDLAMRVSAIDQIRQVLSATTASTLMLSLFSLLYVGQLVYYSWKMAALALLLAVIPLTVAGFASLRKLGVQREVMQVEGQLSGLVLQLLSGVAKLKVAGAEGRALAEWARRFAEQRRLVMRTGGIDAFVETFSAAFPLLTTGCLFWFMMYLNESDVIGAPPALGIGDFIAFNTAFGLLLGQMLQLGTAVLSVLTVLPLYERARPILEAAPEVDETKAHPGDLNGDIELSHVTFRYQADGPVILDDINIKIPAGKYVALVGPSGSGKSTIMRLMLGLESPESGAIFFDGRDLSQLDVQQLRKSIGVVIQNGRIRPGSIFENIVGSSQHTLADAMDAAAKAGLDTDIKEMPMGMHTVLQQGAGSLSGGQRQRLMIARAIVSKPRILFFDEATSALDNRTQAIVSQSLQGLQSTRVAIAHRLSTIIGADRIYVIVKGRVVQQGSYDELVAEEGVFSELIKRQVI